MLGSDYPLHQPGEAGRTGAEVSPYTGEALGITYPKMAVDTLFGAIVDAMPAWRAASPETRIGICRKSSIAAPASCLKTRTPPCIPAARATSWPLPAAALTPWTGAGGVGLCPKAMADVPASALWERQFGKGRRRRKAGETIPPRSTGRGCCYLLRDLSLWNAIPPCAPNLATGNPVYSSRPGAILPVAMVTGVCREVLAQAGFDLNLVSMVADTRGTRHHGPAAAPGDGDS